MKLKIAAVGFLALLLAGLNQVSAQDHIEWLTFEEAIAKSEKKPKKILIDIYTDWCGWCKKMDKDAYENESLVQYINKNYYAVKFNAEQKEDIEFDGHTFKYVANGRRGVHQLAAALTNNKLSYPTTVYMNEDLQIIQSVPGYMNAQSMEPILTYFGENAFKDTPWTEYQKSFKSEL
ncbi:MAG: DUF255 domain-containing protein [Cyclobacteriaceae bacterium]